MRACVRSLAVLIRAAAASAGTAGFGGDAVKNALLPSLGRLAHSLASVAVDCTKMYGSDVKALAAVLLSCCWEVCPGPRARGILSLTIAHTLAYAVARTVSSPAQAAAHCEAKLTLLLSDPQISLHGDQLRDACQSVLSSMIVFET
jgi:hypothetical protein